MSWICEAQQEWALTSHLRAWLNHKEGGGALEIKPHICIAGLLSLTILEHVRAQFYEYVMSAIATLVHSKSGDSNKYDQCWKWAQEGTAYDHVACQHPQIQVTCEGLRRARIHWPKDQTTVFIVLQLIMPGSTLLSLHY